MAANAIALYLVRHATAEPRGADWPDDTARPLTGEGRRRFRRAVEGLAVLDVRLDLVVTSPLTRATQTAKLLARGLRPTPAIQTEPALGPGHTPAHVRRALSTLAPPRAIALVGHEPELGQFAASLLSASAPLAFKKGGACRIDLETWPPSGPGRLVWFLPPRVLRALA